MKKKKIRGNKRLQKQIPIWIDRELNINLDYLKENGYWYSGIAIHPWCDISIINSRLPEPKGETRKQLILGLEKIYISWKKQLDELSVPYYLKIWLYEPRISKSQVVCAIGKRMSYYENSFKEIDPSPKDTDLLGVMTSPINWKPFADYTVMSEDELLLPIKFYSSKEDFLYDRKLLNKLRKSNYAREELGTDIIYYIPKGKIWVGGF